MEQKKKTKLAIIILSVLLAISLLALAVKLFGSHGSAIASVPDNLITEKTSAFSGSLPVKLTAAPDGEGGTSSEDEDKKDEIAIELYDKQPEYNDPFAVENMFPGDKVTKRYCVKVSYHGEIEVHFQTVVQKGYEKLAEVMKVKVVLLTNGKTLYDGLMRDMPDNVVHKLSSSNATVGELEYEITAYLDTSVGNDYQYKKLVADFNWWVSDVEKLGPSPKTGDSSNAVLWAGLATVSAGAIIFLLYSRRRKEDR